MPERVQCAECERIYDSDEHPFCLRCGGTRTSDPVVAARSLAGRSDPRRRRVQVAGVIMLSTGILVLLAGIAMVASAGSVWEFATEYGGSEEVGGELARTATTVEVLILQNGVPVPGVAVTLASGQMDAIATHSTDANGTASFQGIRSMVVEISLVHEETVWDLSFIAVNPTRDPEYVMALHLELSDQSVVNGPLMDEAAVEGTTRFMGIGAILLGVTPILGGVAAVRLRNRQMALFGAVVGAIPWLFLFVASMSLSMLLVMALFIMAVVFVQQGRDLFIH